ncbi:MAG: hypothetical protein ACC608_05090 [Anaerofustis sp.]
MQSKINRFMYGRYGMDRLSRVLIAAGLITDLIAAFVGSMILAVLAPMLLAAAVFRVFSKNKAKRTKENYQFISYMQLLRNRYEAWKKRFEQRKEYRFYKCPDCRTRLRVPRGKGRILVTCPKCKKGFFAKS